MDWFKKLFFILFFILLIDACQKNVLIPSNEILLENKEEFIVELIDGGGKNEIGVENKVYENNQNIEKFESLGETSSSDHGFQCLIDKDCLDGRVCHGCKCIVRQCDGIQDCKLEISHCNFRTAQCVPNCRCLGDSECKQDQVCENCNCIIPIPCKTNSDCPSHRSCERGVCWRINCQKDTDCIGDSVCGIHGNTCAEARCKTNNDCFPQLCKDGRCAQVECRTNTDCQMGTICGNYCTYMRCKTCLDCFQGLACVDGYCKP